MIATYCLMSHKFCQMKTVCCKANVPVMIVDCQRHNDKSVREWKKQRKHLKKLSAKNKLLDGAGRIYNNTTKIEELLILWIDEVKANNYYASSAKLLNGDLLS